MKYMIDFQKEYKISEKETQNYYVVIIDNIPHCFIKTTRPSSWKGVDGDVTVWSCGSYSTREFQADVSLDDVISAFRKDTEICSAIDGRTGKISEVYFDRD